MHTVKGCVWVFSCDYKITIMSCSWTSAMSNLVAVVGPHGHRHDSWEIPSPPCPFHVFHAAKMSVLLIATQWICLGLFPMFQMDASSQIAERRNREFERLRGPQLAQVRFWLPNLDAQSKIWRESLILNMLCGVYTHVLGGGEGSELKISIGIACRLFRGLHWKPSIIPWTSHKLVLLPQYSSSRFVYLFIFVGNERGCCKVHIPHWLRF